MAKSVMISIRPEWVQKILRGEKTVEVRKTAPKNATPFKCYIYCTRGKSKDNWGEVYGGYVIGEFVCNNIRSFDVPYPAFQKEMDKSILEQSCLTYYQLHRYAYHDKLYGWHISNLKVYDKPKELCEFTKYSEVDNRPCENGGECQYDYYDYSEDCRACGIDFDGEACPFIKMQRPPQSWCYVEEL